MKKNKITWIFLMFLFGNLASSALTFMISWTVLRQTHQASQFALISTVSSLVMLVAMPFIGILVDKYNHKILLLTAQFFSVFVLLIFNIQPFQNLITYILFSIGLDLGDLLFTITMYASVKSLSENKEDMVKINSIEQGIGTTFSILAPAIAGTLLTIMTVQIFSWIELICELFVAFIITNLTFKDRNSITEVQKKAEKRASYATVVKFLQKKYLLLIIIGVMIILNFLLGAVNVGVPVIINREFSGNTFFLGIVQMSFPIGLILGSILFQKLRNTNIFKLLKLSYFACAFTILAFGLAFELGIAFTFLLIALLALLMFGLGLALGISKIPMMTFAQNNIPENIQGRTFSVIDTSAQILAPIGLMFYGFLFDHLQAQEVYVISGVCMILIVFIAFRFVDRIDKSSYSL